MRNAVLVDSQAGNKIAWRNIINLRYDSNLTPPKMQKAKSLLMKVKEEESEKTGLKQNMKKLRPWHLVPSLHGK